MAKSEISEFTERFLGDSTEAFTNGCCYWFAYILQKRFEAYNATIMYSSVDNHFATKIGDKIYDITGDVTSKYEWDKWDNFDDDLEKVRIIRDCIMF